MIISCYHCHNPLWCSQECSEQGSDDHYEELCDQGYHLEVVTVSKENKTWLFRGALQTSQERSESETLIEKISELDPTVGCDFELKSNAVPEAPLRLLRMGRQGEASYLTPTSSPFTFKSFIALSYCWHNPYWELADGLELTTMHVGGATLPTPVSKKMFVALSTIRSSEEEGLWIDQLCINQNDDAEKQVAVASMDILYKSARMVLTVLEDIVFNGEELEIWDRYTDEWEDDDNWKPSEEGKASMPALLVKIFSARWFSRVWCIHEHHVGSNSRIIINFETGENSIASSLDQLGQCLQRALECCDDPVWYRKLWDLTNNVEGQLFRWSIPSGRREFAAEAGLTIPLPPLMQLISMVFSLSATVTQDKLSVAFNICGLNVYFKGKLLTADECCAIYSMLALAAGDATVLCTRGKKLRLGEKSEVSSWMQWPVCFYRIQAANMALNSAPHFSVNPRELVLDLYFLQKHSLRSPTKESLDCATKLHQFLEQKGMFVLHHRRGTNIRSFIGGLAVALDCGLDWMVQAWEILSSTEGAIDRYTLSSLEDAAAAYAELEEIMKILTDGAPERLNSEDDEIQFRKKLVNFIFAHYNSDESADASIATGAKGQRGVCKPCQAPAIVIPVVLAGPEYNIYERLWFLEPVEGNRDNCWRIVEKSSLFGCSAIVDDGLIISVRKRQLIIG